jgi:hypothetical protein
MQESLSNMKGKDGVTVKITAVGERKILADRNGYEDVYQNDGEWVVQ